MKVKNVPRPVDSIISLGIQVYAGTQAIGNTVGLEQNTALKIAPELHDLIGDPATPLVPGKQSQYAAQKLVVKQAVTGRVNAVKAGIEYCRLAIGVLKSVLGPRWNAQWYAAGFVAPSLALTRDPVPMLVQFREYFNANPAREVATINVTSARAQLHLTQIGTVQLAEAQARSQLILRKGLRDFAVRTLRERIMGLRVELEQLLGEDDGRWYEFGFRRPADRQMPDEVEELELTPAGPGVVLVNWEAVALADNYRVTWYPQGNPQAATQVGLFTETQCAISGLPSGVTVTIAVSARNASGETDATEGDIMPA